MVAVFKPVNPSDATTSTCSRHYSEQPASQALTACVELPSTTSTKRAGPISSLTGARPMTTITYLPAVGMPPHVRIHP